MTILDLAARRASIVERYGEWTDHNIRLADDVYTIRADWVSEKLRRVLQIVTDFAGGSVDGLRILDLACLEGQYAIELGLHGAEVVGIEGREANVEKARFAQDTLGLRNVRFFQDDVRNLSPEKYGQFDIVLCLGILYHLDAPDVFRFVEQIAAACRRFAVFDTFVSIKGAVRHEYSGKVYYGRNMHEHNPAATREERLRDRWASLDNPKSFWMTRVSLYNLLSANGFTSAYDCQVPFEQHKPSDRLTVVAIKGRSAAVKVTPKANEVPVSNWPNGFTPVVSYQQRTSTEVAKAFSSLVPKRLKRPLKTFKAAITGQHKRDQLQTWDKGRRG